MPIKNVLAWAKAQCLSTGTGTYYTVPTESAPPAKVHDEVVLEQAYVGQLVKA